MNAKLVRIFLALIFMATLGGMFVVSKPVSVKADTVPDILGSYSISITPQSDGTLLMKYSLQDYCVKIDVWPSDQPYLQVGVPNDGFSVVKGSVSADGIKVTQAEEITDSGDFVQLDFDSGHLPKKGDCFNLGFSIIQGQMAYSDSTNNQTTFKFIAGGWDFPITVKTLTITWALPTPTSLLKVATPKPMSTSADGKNMVWTWNSPAMASDHKFDDYSVGLAYDPTAFQLSDTAKTTNSSGNGGSGGSGIIILIVVIVVIVLVVVVVAVMASDGDGYGGGGIGIFGGGGGGGHSGGGGLGGGGGGYSCACAGCACACACAGGGRVGCGRKGIGVRCFMKIFKKTEEEHEEEKDT